METSNPINTTVPVMQTSFFWEYGMGVWVFSGKAHGRSDNYMYIHVITSVWSCNNWVDVAHVVRLASGVPRGKLAYFNTANFYKSTIASWQPHSHYKAAWLKKISYIKLKLTCLWMLHGSKLRRSCLYISTLFQCMCHYKFASIKQLQNTTLQNWWGQMRNYPLSCTDYSLQNVQ